MVLERLALSRSLLDRRAEERSNPELIARLWADDATAVVVLRGGQAPVSDLQPTSGLLRLAVPRTTELRRQRGSSRLPSDWPGVFVAYLGRALGSEFLLIAAGEGAELPPEVESAPSFESVTWAGLRDVGVALDDLGVGLMTTAVALSGWHERHPTCSRCGAPTVVVQAGWSRRCPNCGAEHYPRTDPAVIMTVVDGRGRILLGHQAAWPERRFSTLAGFVEPGESLEDAVRREVLEEAGIVVGDVSYQGSQPWPFPASLMCGFRAHALSTEISLNDGELTLAQWWDRGEFTTAVAAGELLLPSPVSIARRLIEDWYGEPLPSSTTWG